jgi:hypothetical protein
VIVARLCAQAASQAISTFFALCSARASPSRRRKPTAEEVANFVAASAKYGYVLGASGERITMPLFAG